MATLYFLVVHSFFDPNAVRKPQVTPLQMRQLCGNAMHCGVLAKVLEKLLA